VAVTAAPDELCRTARAHGSASSSPTGASPRPASRARHGHRRDGAPGRPAPGSEQPLRIEQVTEPGLLPDRAAGYDAVGVVYLGDVPPAALSDAQVDALRGFAARGGLLVAGSAARLRADERFRALFRPPARRRHDPPARAGARGRIAGDAGGPGRTPPALGQDCCGARSLAGVVPASGRAVRGTPAGCRTASPAPSSTPRGCAHASALTVGLFLLGYLCSWCRSTSSCCAACAGPNGPGGRSLRSSWSRRS
jgi:hypothetical protein